MISGIYLYSKRQNNVETVHITVGLSICFQRGCVLTTICCLSQAGPAYFCNHRTIHNYYRVSTEVILWHHTAEIIRRKLQVMEMTNVLLTKLGDSLSTISKPAFVSPTIILTRPMVNGFRWPASLIIVLFKMSVSCQDTFVHKRRCLV